MSGSDDLLLIEACRAGDVDAFGVLVSRYQDRLYPTALRLTGHPDDAHDLLQDAFLRSFEKLDRFRGDSSFLTWVYRIMVNLALSARRRSRARPALASGRGEAIERVDPPDPSGRADPTLGLERSEREARIQQALNELPPEYRAVVVLKEYDGLRYDEIAAALSIPVGTVRSRLHRARLDLRDRLKGLVEEPLNTQLPAHDPG